MLVNAAGDMASNDAKKFPARTMMNLPSCDNAVHVFLAVWTLVALHLFVRLRRFHVQQWRARSFLAGGVRGGSTRADTTCRAIWQSLLAALRFLGVRNPRILLVSCENFFAHFVYDGLLPSTFFASP